VRHPSEELGPAWLWLRLRYPRERRIPTDLTPAERLLLLRLARGVRRGGGTTFVELGSYLGASACFIARGIRGGNGRARLHCVDTWRNDAMSEGPRDTWEEFRANVRPCGDLVVPVRSGTVAAAAGFAGPVHFLFVDADHDYEAVRADIRAWFPLLAPGATVAFHDVRFFPGVARAFAELVAPQAAAAGGLPNLSWARLRAGAPGR